MSKLIKNLEELPRWRRTDCKVYGSCGDSQPLIPDKNGEWIIFDVVKRNCISKQEIHDRIKELNDHHADLMVDAFFMCCKNLNAKRFDISEKIIKEIDDLFSFESIFSLINQLGELLDNSSDNQSSTDSDGGVD